MNLDVRKRLLKEFDGVIKKTGGKSTYEAISKMTYMEAVNNETLRMFLPGPVIDKLCTGDHELPPVLPGAKPIKLAVVSNVLIPIH